MGFGKEWIEFARELGDHHSTSFEKREPSKFPRLAFRVLASSSQKTIKNNTAVGCNAKLENVTNTPHKVGRSDLRPLVVVWGIDLDLQLCGMSWKTGVAF